MIRKKKLVPVKTNPGKYPPEEQERILAEIRVKVLEMDREDRLILCLDEVYWKSTEAVSSVWSTRCQNVKFKQSIHNWIMCPSNHLTNGIISCNLWIMIQRDKHPVITNGMMHSLA